MEQLLRVGVVLAGVLLAAACGDPRPDPSAGNPSSSAEAASASPSPSTETRLWLVESPQATTDGTPAGRLCAYLAGAQLDIARASGTDEARSTLARGLARLGGEQADLRDAITAHLDTLTSQRCPETRDAVLTALGADNFTEALGLPPSPR